MPGYLLNTESEVLCTHGGTGTPTVTLARVQVMGAPAVGQPAPYSIAGCPYEMPTTPPTPSPCVLASGWQGAATRVTSMEIAVLLVSSKAQCVPNGVPTTVTPSQTRVTGT